MIKELNWYQKYKIARDSKKEKSYAWVALDLPDNIKNKIKKFQKTIDKKDLYIDNEDWHGFGLEKNPHITVKYGIEIDDPEEIKDVLSKESGGEVSFDNIDVFKQDDYDVLVLRMKSNSLNKLHNTLKDNVKNVEKYPEYKPHITIAYLLKDKVNSYKKQAEEFFSKDFSFYFDSVFFEDADDNKTNINL